MFRLSAIVGSSLVIAVVLVTAGCGGMEQSSTTTSSPVTVTVNILGNRFDAQELTVGRGSTVIWHNTTSVTHGIMCNNEFDADLRPGQDFHHTFSSSGYFVVYNRRYPESPGLTMEIRVE